MFTMPRISRPRSLSKPWRGWPQIDTKKAAVLWPGCSPLPAGAWQISIACGLSGRLNDPPSPEPGLLAVIEKGQDLQRLACLLSQLDEDQQELLRLRFSAGLSFAEISLLDGRSEAAVKMAVYRTIDFLREHWEVENE